MSNVVVGFLLGAGLAAWIYSKMYRSTGGNSKSALIVAACAGIGAMVLLIVLLNTFVKS